MAQKKSAQLRQKSDEIGLLRVIWNEKHFSLKSAKSPKLSHKSAWIYSSGDWSLSRQNANKGKLSTREKSKLTCGYMWKWHWISQTMAWRITLPYHPFRQTTLSSPVTTTSRSTTADICHSDVWGIPRFRGTRNYAGEDHHPEIDPFM